MPTPSHGLHVEFYMGTQHSEFESEKAGRPIYLDCEMVQIMIPGDSKTMHDRVASDFDKQRFVEEYARFKSGMKEREQAVGTPLGEWPAMPRSLVKNLEFLNIHTVEQLANLSDTGKQAFGMGAEAWCQKAKTFIATAANSAHAEKLAVENMELKRRLEDLQKQFIELSSQFEKSQKAPGRAA